MRAAAIDAAVTGASSRRRSSCGSACFNFSARAASSGAALESASATLFFDQKPAFLELQINLQPCGMLRFELVGEISKPVLPRKDREQVAADAA